VISVMPAVVEVIKERQRSKEEIAA